MQNVTICHFLKKRTEEKERNKRSRKTFGGCFPAAEVLKLGSEGTKRQIFIRGITHPKEQGNAAQMRAGWPSVRRSRFSLIPFPKVFPGIFRLSCR